MAIGKRIESAVRALRILEMVKNSQKGLRLYEIAQALTMSMQTTHNYVGTLLAGEYLERLGSPTRYTPGPALVNLGRHGGDWDRLVLAPAIPKVIAIAKECRGDVFVSRLVAGEPITRFLVRWTGEPECLFCFWLVEGYGTGLLYQAFMAPDELDDFRARHPLAAQKGFGDFCRSEAVLDEFLAIVRREGYLTLCKGGSIRIAVPVSFPGSPVDCLSSISFVRSLDEMQPGEVARAVELLKDAARSLSAKLRASRVDPDRAGSYRPVARARSKAGRARALRD
jgi:DNA-binding IclR family transcriptional regulator